VELDEVEFQITKVKFDIIKNRFIAELISTDKEPVKETYTIDRGFFSQIFNSLASTPGGNPFINEHEEREIRKRFINVLKGGNDRKGKGRKIQCAILSTDLGKKGKEISGPQKAAQEVVKLIQEVRTIRPDININKNLVKKRIEEKYGWLFDQYTKSLEVERYNFFLYQMEEMRKAKLVRIDDLKSSVDVSRIKGFEPLASSHDFSPLLVTPNANIELNSFTETYEQLLWIPNNQEFADKFYKDCQKVYIAHGYSEATITNNIVVQLLLLNGYISMDDLSRGKMTEKANRETIAAAKYAAVKKYRESSQKQKTSKNK
jgi:hypothetical protein